MILKEFLKSNWKKSIIFVIVLIVVSVTSSNLVMYDYSYMDGPKGIGFPFAFYIGGGGLCLDSITKQPVICPFKFFVIIFIIDFLVWMAVSAVLSFFIIWIYNKNLER